MICITLRYYASSFLLYFWKYLHLQDLKRNLIEHLLYARLGIQWWTRPGASLVVWWLRPCIHPRGAHVQSLVGELKIPRVAQRAQLNGTKKPLKTVVNKTGTVLAPHVTYIVLFVNKHIRKKEIITLYYAGKEKNLEKNRFPKADTYFGVLWSNGKQKRDPSFPFPQPFGRVVEIG